MDLGGIPESGLCENGEMRDEGNTELSVPEREVT